jgi:glyoxylase-like metal-dependent hydrolase (beta-lactamase superfamily II)/ferredoxin
MTTARRRATATRRGAFSPRNELTLPKVSHNTTHTFAFKRADSPIPRSSTVPLSRARARSTARRGQSLPGNHSSPPPSFCAPTPRTNPIPIQESGARGGRREAPAQLTAMMQLPMTSCFGRPVASSRPLSRRDAHHRPTPTTAAASSSSSSGSPPGWTTNNLATPAVVVPTTELDWTKLDDSKPRQRRPENDASADFWVDDACISCRVCRRMAGFSFAKVNGQSAVLRNPATPQERTLAYQAMLSCPTFSIHATAKGPEAAAELRAARDALPLPAFEGSEDVSSVGFTDVKAIATWSYVVRRRQEEWGSVLFDAPRFTPAAVDAVLRACGGGGDQNEGPAYMVLSHRDDIGEHDRWAARFPNMRRVVHEREADAVASLRACEVILRGHGPWRLPDGGQDVTLLLTPGHTSGSITLLYSPEAVALTGDHLDAAPPANEYGVVLAPPVAPPPSASPPSPPPQDLHVFRDYCWDDMGKQLRSVAKLAGRAERGTPILRVLPGHGSPAFFESPGDFDAAVARLLAAELGGEEGGGAAAAEALLAEAREALARELAPVVPVAVPGSARAR